MHSKILSKPTTIAAHTKQWYPDIIKLEGLNVMPFAALLIKELRSRLRRERTVWIIIVYVLLMSLIGWIIVSRWTNSSSYYYGGFSDAGTTLYTFLSMIQLFLFFL